jgi:leader peptidase (prepilin peptidase)/N-methyltransferase
MKAVRDAALPWQVSVAVALAWLSITALGLTAATIPAIYIAAVAPELTRVDLREHRLPNRMVLPGLVAGVIAAALGWSLVPLVAALAYAGLLGILAIAGGIGMGDVKLAALLGLASPTLAVAVAAPLAAFVLGGVAASIVLARGGRKSRIAFGPYLLAGYVVALALSTGVSSMGAGAP